MFLKYHAIRTMFLIKVFLMNHTVCNRRRFASFIEAFASLKRGLNVSPDVKYELFISVKITKWVRMFTWPIFFAFRRLDSLCSGWATTGYCFKSGEGSPHARLWPWTWCPSLCGTVASSAYPSAGTAGFTSVVVEGKRGPHLNIPNLFHF